VIVPPLSEALGQKIVVENKPGADGVIAGNEVRGAAADGYTLLYGTNTGMCAAPAMHKSASYDPIADFTPIALIGKFGFFVFVNGEVPAKSMAEFIAHVRKNPGKLHYGTGNSTSILTTAQLLRNEKLEMVHVPFKGDAPASTELLAGRIHLVIGTPGPTLPHVKEGKIRALATLLKARSPLLPDVPTMPEAGQQPITVQPFAALYGPANLPRDVVQKLARAAAAVMARAEVREAVGRQAFEAQSSTPEQLAAFHKEQLEIWRRYARELNLTVD
jgi:tripartite-type tricarboxylate transporter receptor subunit TctC